MVAIREIVHKRFVARSLPPAPSMGLYIYQTFQSIKSEPLPVYSAIYIPKIGIATKNRTKAIIQLWKSNTAIPANIARTEITNPKNNNDVKFSYFNRPNLH